MEEMRLCSVVEVAELNEGIPQNKDHHTSTKLLKDKFCWKTQTILEITSIGKIER